MDDNLQRLEQKNMPQKMKTLHSPLDPSNNSLISGGSSLMYSPSNIASSTTQSNYLKQFTK